MTCGRPRSRSTLHSAPRGRVPSQLWVGAPQSACRPPPTPAGSACSSLSRPPLSSSQATSPTPVWPRREPQQRSLQVSHPRQLPSVPIQPSFPAHPNSRAPSFPPHYTPSGATGRAAGPLRGWPPPPHPRPAGCSASGKGPCSGAQLSRLPPSWPWQSPRAPRPAVKMCPSGENRVLRRNDLKLAGSSSYQISRLAVFPKC